MRAVISFTDRAFLTGYSNYFVHPINHSSIKVAELKNGSMSEPNKKKHF